MNTPLVDLKAQYNSIKEEIDEAMRRVIAQGEFILGSEVEALEKEIAAYCSTKYATGVNSGTDALQLALLACDIKPGDGVITTPFTFIATAETIAKCGAVPVFVDIDPRTFNISPAEVESKISHKTKAILPVHLYGQPADMSPIMELARRFNLKVIEDCAQALGAEYKGKRVGSIGDVGCLSFFPSKVLGAYGDGGMIVTNNLDIAEKARMLRNHGSKERYYYLTHGFNSRLDSLQAAILRVKLRHLDDWIEERRKKASLYTQLLDKVEGIEPPHAASYARHVFNYYTIRVKDSSGSRDRLQKYLSAQGIASAIYYPLSLHLQKVYKPLGYKLGDLPQSELAQAEVLSLPIYPELSEGQIRKIVEAVTSFGKVEAVR